MSSAGRPQVLFLTPQLPWPPEQGGAIRNYFLMREAARHCDVSLLSLVEAPPRPQDLAALAFCRRIETIPVPARSRADRLRTLLRSRDPDMAHRLASCAYAEALRRWLGEAVDLVQVEGMEMARYGLLLADWATAASPPVVFDALNAEYLLQKRAMGTDLLRPRRWPHAAYSAVQWLRLRRYERLACQRASLTVAVSELDARALQALGAGIRPVVVPNGVDTASYPTDLPDSLGLQHPNLVFTGKMDYRPNVDAMRWFVSQVWPLIRAQLPAVHLYIVGKQPHRDVQALDADPAITVTGYVPEVRPYFGGADVYIVPMRVGGGTRLKVLEALATGMPMVSTSLGVEGLAVQDGRHCLLADTPAAFAEATLRLLRQPALGRQLGQAARALAEERYDWTRLAPLLLAAWQPLLSRTGA
ncbi:MAG: glycosyltransferase [Anaerolineae bacterium]|jgi:glycosyltransferase involved in cell wall biosynthesis|nr:glycosyltransferase [Chloroflexota bacterium]